MKTIKFRRHLAEDILAGKKHATWRLYDDKDLSVGDVVELLIWETLEKFADAEIVQVREKKLSEIEESDFEGHEKFADKEEMLQVYKKYYGDRVNWDTVVKMVEFKLLERY